MSSPETSTAATAARLASDVESLTSAAGWVNATHSVVWVSGADAISFLDALISQSVAPMEPGEVRRSLLLTPQGKMRALLWVLRGGPEEIGLVTQRTTAGIVVDDLTRFRFRVAADISLDDRPVATLVGPAADDALSAADLPRPGTGWLRTSGGLLAAISFLGHPLSRYVLVGDAAKAITQSAVAIDPEAYNVVRIAVGEPLGTVDFDDSTISHELGHVDAAVDFTKGCYLGQELVARIDSRGRVTRRMRAVATEQAIDLTGATLTREGKVVGTVTSSGAHPSGKGSLSLALIRHEVEDTAQLQAALGGREVPATVTPLPALGGE